MMLVQDSISTFRNSSLAAVLCSTFFPTSNLGCISYPLGKCTTVTCLCTVQMEPLSLLEGVYVHWHIDGRLPDRKRTANELHTLYLRYCILDDVYTALEHCGGAYCERYVPAYTWLPREVGARTSPLDGAPLPIFLTSASPTVADMSIENIATLG